MSGKVAKSDSKPVALPALHSRFYAADDIAKPLRNCKKNGTAKLKSNYLPGTVLIVLAGRFKGKRVVFLKQLKSGLLLISGPFKLNGVPLRRINQVYTLATSVKVDVSGVDTKAIEDSFFTVEKSTKSKTDFFATEKKKPVLSAEKKAAMKAVDTAVVAGVKKGDKLLPRYLKSYFSLQNDQAPHLLKF